MNKKSLTAKDLRFAIVAVDFVLFTIKDGELHFKVIFTGKDSPYKAGTPALPGGVILPDETAEEAVARHIANKTKITFPLYYEQLYTFSAIERDPRGRVVSIAYIGLINEADLAKQKTPEEGVWMKVGSNTTLAYDHNIILKAALERLRSRLHYTTLVTKLMPQEFTLTELESAYETILKVDLDKRNFRKKILKTGILEELKKKREGQRHRPASLYRFKKKEVEYIEMI